MHKFIKATIEVRFHLKTAMHIGSSEEFILAPTKHPENNQSQASNVSLIALNEQGLPFIPAATIKGTLRAAYRKDHTDNDALYFGQNSAQGKQQCALSVFNAGIVSATSPEQDGIIETTHVAIDPLTKTRKDNHLFAKQWVSAGTCFTSQISFEHICEPDLDHFINFLQQTHVHVGGAASLGAGQVDIELVSCRVLNQQQLETWLTSPGNINQYYLPHQVKIKPLLQRASMLTLQVHLLPQAPFLSHCAKRKSQCEQQAKAGERTFDQYTTVNNQAKPYIPASSLKGVLRHHVNKIATTLKIADTENLINSIFGSTERQSSVVVCDASTTETIAACKHEQTLIAIDRFTGGVEHGALKDMQGCYPERFTFTLQFNKSKVTPLAALLWCFTIRDLMAGKIYFGANSAIGYGKMTASIDIESQPFQCIENLLPVFLDYLSLTKADLQAAEQTLQGATYA